MSLCSIINGPIGIIVAFLLSHSVCHCRIPLIYIIKLAGKEKHKNNDKEGSNPSSGSNGPLPAEI
jgi:hypothetical protein